MAVALHYATRVLYGCSCAQLAPLGELYFCRHCKVPRCQACVSTNIDSYSCPHCFDSFPLTEAKNKKNRCHRCFKCPQCAATLTTRSVIVPSEVLGEHSPQKRDTDTQASPTLPQRSAAQSPGSYKSPGGTKLYFLSCSHCKWSTREVGMRDKRSPSDFKEQPSPHRERVAELVSFCHEHALHDRAEREKSKRSGRRASARMYGSLLDPSKFSLRGGGPTSPSPSRRGQLVWDPSLPRRVAAKANPSPEPAPEELFSSTVNLEEVPTLEQLFLDPVHQPSSTCHFSPRPLHLVGKKLHRCKGCDHILLKAEINPSSIRFKIQQMALHAFPQIRILEPPALKPEQPCEVLLSLNNPVNYAISVSFSDCPANFLRQLKEPLTPVSLPEGEFALTPSDDMSDLLEGDADSETEDNPQHVHSRLPGRLVMKFSVEPEATSEDTRFIFTLKFTHKSTLEDKQNEMCNIEVPVLVNVGRSKK